MSTMLSRKAAWAGALALGAAVAMAPSESSAYVWNDLISGTTTLNKFVGWSDATFSYKVEYDDTTAMDVIWRYTYTLSDPNPSKGISHMLIEATFSTADPFTTANILSSSPSVASDGVKTWTPTENGNSNFGMPGNLYGFKLEQPFSSTGTNPVVSTAWVISDHAPMWGDVYLIDGKKPGEETYAYNTGFGTNANPVEPTSAQWSAILAATDPGATFLSFVGCGTPKAACTAWALTPDSVVVATPVPVPAALPIIGAALAGFGFVGWRQQRKPA